VSQNRYGLTTPSKKEFKSGDNKALEQLLQLVVAGEQNQVEKMLKGESGLLGWGETKGNPNLLLHHGTVTDLSGRTFENVTAFQYALWALDWYMWRMIQKYLPEEAQKEQFTELETKGTSHGKHFSLQPLIDALQVYMEKAEKEWKYDQRATDH
jgi:hypothetical protein